MPSPQQTLDRAIAAWNDGRLDEYLDLYADDIRLHGYAPEPLDRAGVRAFYEGIVAAFGSTRLELHETLWDGDACAIRATMTGRHVGTFNGIEPTGTDIALPTITLLHFDADGRCAERWAQADMLGLMIQLGAIPAPA
jgi:predicted ester cyclase